MDKRGPNVSLPEFVWRVFPSRSIAGKAVQYMNQDFIDRVKYREVAQN